MDDEEICRVCRCESTLDHPLYHPCKCSGSIRFVHQDCLLEWLSHSKKKYCELCDHAFNFTPIYRDDMPDRIPLGVLLGQCIRRLALFLKIVSRAIIVALVWLVILPYSTLWAWRFYFWSGENIGFARYSAQSAGSTEPSANKTDSTGIRSFTQGFNFRSFLADCFEGQIITAMVVIVFVAAFLFREWVVQNTHANPDLDQQVDNQERDEEQHAERHRPADEEGLRLTQQHVTIDTLRNALQAMSAGDDQGAEDRVEFRARLEELLHREMTRRREEGIDDGDVIAVDPADSSLFTELDRRAVRDMSNEPEYWHDEEYRGSSNLDCHSHPDSSHVSGNVYAESSDMAMEGSSSQPLYDTKGKHRAENAPKHDDDYRGSLSPQWRGGHDHYDDDNVNDKHTEPSSSSRLRWRSPKPETIDEEDERLLGYEPDQDPRNRLFGDLQHTAGQTHEQAHQGQHENQVERAVPNNGNEVGPGGAEDDDAFVLGDDFDGILEAVGMRGNPWMLMQNSVLMSLMISLCLGVAMWIPYIIGRLVILIRPVSLVHVPIFLMRFVSDPIVDFLLDQCVPVLWKTLLSVSDKLPEELRIGTMALWEKATYIFANFLDTPLPVATTNEGVSSSASRFIPDDVIDKANAVLVVVMKRWHRFATGHTGLDRAVCVMVGYLVLIFIGSWYLSRTSSSIRRRATGINEMIRQQGVFIKVLFFLIFELVVFPLLCGILLDIATLPLIKDATMTSRCLFAQENPYSSGFLHWFIGTGFMFQFAIFVTLCREIVRPGVMWFIRDPNDPHFHPVQDILERPALLQLRKNCLSFLMYLTLIMVGIGSVAYAISHFSSFRTIHWNLDAPISTLPIDLLVVQFVWPQLIKFVQPKDLFKKLMTVWWRLVSRKLRLMSFMFHGRYPDEEGTHVQRTWAAWLLRRKAPTPPVDYADVAINETPTGDVAFIFDGQLVRVPNHDSVPVQANRRMIVPVDPVTLQPLDETERRLGHPAASESGTEENNTTVVYIPPHFNLRITFFLFLMWFSGFVFACALILIPTLLGRHLFEEYLAPGKLVHDVYPFTVGIYAIVLLGAFINWLAHGLEMLGHYNWREELSAIISSLKTQLQLVLKALYLGTVCGFVLPLLVGIALDLYLFMPIRYSKPNDALVLHVSEDWSFGVIALSIILGIASVLPNNVIQRQVALHFGQDLGGINIVTITRGILAPLSGSILGVIIVPSMLAWGVITSLAMTDTSLQLLIIRCAYPVVFCFAVAVGFCMLAIRMTQMWIRTVRDETYLIGKQLHNLDDISSPTLAE